MKIAKEALKTYKSKFPTYLAYSMMVGFIIILVFAVGYFLPPMFIVTVPFIVIPFFYCGQLSITHVANNQPYTLRTFSLGYKYYFSPKAYGCYSSLWGLLKAAIAFTIAYIIASVTITSIYLNLDPSFADLVNQLGNIKSIEEYMTIAEKLMQNNSFVMSETLTMAISLFPALYMFVHHVLVNSFKACMTFYSKPEEQAQFHKLIFKQTFRYLRRDFYKDYYGAFWFLIPLFIVGYAGGVTIGILFVPNCGPLESQTLGLVGSLLVMLMFLPYIFITMDLIHKKYRERMAQVSLDDLITTLDKFLEQEKLSEEDKKFLQELKESRKEFDKEDKNKTPDNGGK